MGHQDRTGLPLICYELLNIIEMDTLANHFCETCTSLPGHPNLCNLTFANEGWSVWLNNSKIVSPTKSTLYKLLTKPSICSYWTTPHTLQPTPRLSLATFDMVDWAPTDQFMKRLPPGKQCWCSKPHGLEHCG